MLLNQYPVISSFFIIFSIHCSSEISQGLKYEKIQRKNPPQSIHILQVNPRFMNIELGIAGNKCAHALTTHEIGIQNKAIAAINGGFFDYGSLSPVYNRIIKFFDDLGIRAQNAFPLWTVKNNNLFFSVSPVITGALAWNKLEQRPLFTELKTTVRLTINGIRYPVPVFNKPTREGPCLYSATYNSVTPHFPKSVIEICILKDEVIEIHKASHGNRPIPSGGYIYVMPIRQYMKRSTIALKNPVSISFDVTSSIHAPVSWDSYETILASTPVLIKNRKITETVKNRTSGFARNPQPRTAVGILADGSWLFIVADGRQKNARGLTLLELAHLMEELGCTEALNLDGGGSSTMVIKGNVINAPSGGPYSLSRKERSISNALVIRPKNENSHV